MLNAKEKTGSSEWKKFNTEKKEKKREKKRSLFSPFFSPLSLCLKNYLFKSKLIAN